MTGSMIGCVFDIYFSTKNDINAEKIASSIIKNTPYEQMGRLPASEVPDLIRKNDSEFRKEPLYELSKESDLSDIVVVGDGILGITMRNEPYEWEKFFENLKVVYEAFLRSNVIQSIERMGLRHIFFKEINIFQTKILLGEQYGAEEKHNLRSEKIIEDSNNNFNCINITANRVSYKGESGSVVDLTLSTKKNLSFGNDYKKFFKDVELMHKLIQDEKNKVFGDS